MEKGAAMTGLELMRRSVRTVVAVGVAWVIVVITPGSAAAQFFDSGSSGIHGEFPPVPTGGMPTTFDTILWNVRTGHVWYCNGYSPGTGVDACNAGGTVAEAQIPNIPAGGLMTGVYEFTNFAVTTVSGQYRSVYVVGASPNVPLTILSQTDITLIGNSGYTVQLAIRGWDGRAPADTARNLSVVGGRGGPGGFDGGASGNGGTTPGDGAAGLGPSGGLAGSAGATTAEGLSGLVAQATPLNPSLVPLSGGSGGGGGAGVGPSPVSGCGAAATGYAGGGGGGGGGALLLAATNRVTIGAGSNIYAHGGNGGYSYANCGFGAGGSGGSIRIVATEITGTGAIYLQGGTRYNGAVQASGGFIRLESSINTYTGAIVGSAGGSFISFPTAPLPTNQPQLRITAINGTSAPTTPSASLTAPDIAFPAAIETPVTLDVAASNVPLGTTVNIRVAPAVGSPTTAVSSALTGTVASSTAQATVTLPPGAGVVTATATFNVSQSDMAANAIPLIDGERPQRVEVVAQADGQSKTYLVARSGARFEVSQGRP
jgi:hypothetical protein